MIASQLSDSPGAAAEIVAFKWRGKMDELHEVHTSLLVTGAGFFLIIAGIILVLHQSINPRRRTRGRIVTEFSLRKWSFKSIFIAVMMIGIGAVLVGTGLRDH